MQSEFYRVALDQIRYSLVWEDSYNLYRGLQIQPADRVLIITSAGCNVLNTLLAKPRQVIAIDLNPVQNKLLALKCHTILHHGHSILRGLMGFDGVAAVEQAWTQLEISLPDDQKRYWAAFFASHPEGILTAGRLESYVTGFFNTLDLSTGQKLQALIRFDNLEEQYKFFLNELHQSSFQEKFIAYFSDENLSKGRDPKLFMYARESGGEAFYNRLVRQLSSSLVRHNFFFRFFFFGPTGLPESILPPCYQRKNYLLLRKHLPKLTIADGEATDYLLSAKGVFVNKASLSNIFEYTSPDEFEKVSLLLLSRANRKLRFVFWNLLQEQGASLDMTCRDTIQSFELPSQPGSCFYFRNVRVMESRPIPACSSPAATRARLQSRADK